MEVRAACKALAARLAPILPAGREASLFVTKVEEAMFWANAAIARSQPVGEVIDFHAVATRRQEARHEILQAANKVRLQRARYVNWTVAKPVEPPKLLAMANLQQAVAIVRHWGVVDEATLTAAGFRAGKRLRPAPAGADLMEDAA